MPPLTVVVLAAGMGTRLGRPIPKPLTALADGRTILEQQVHNIARVWPHAQLLLVVGFKMDLVMEALPEALFVYNDAYDRTNTARSLERALRHAAPGPVVWMNGDVVFDHRALERLGAAVDAGRTAVCVNTSATADEEVKYTLDAEGHVAELSKSVQGALGEAVGINTVASADRAVVLRRLAECEDQDYFERGLEVAAQRDGLRISAVDISDLFAVEVDFEEDLVRANRGR